MKRSAATTITEPSLKRRREGDSPKQTTADPQAVDGMSAHIEPDHAVSPSHTPVDISPTTPLPLMAENGVISESRDVPLLPADDEVSMCAGSEPPLTTAEALEKSINVRLAHYGASNFLISLGLTCNLTLNTILMALRLHHRGRKCFSDSSVDKNATAAAALCLAWKHWEDREGLRHGQKVRDLARAMFLLARHDQFDESESAGLAAIHWTCRDGGAELGRLRDRIKLHEVLLLRALDFDIVMQDGDYFTGMFAVAIRQICPHVESDITVFDRLQSVALGIVLDFFRWPCAVEYALKDITVAAVFKAVVTLGVRVTSPSIFANQQISVILRDFRRCYDWVAEIEVRLNSAGL